MLSIWRDRQPYTLIYDKRDDFNFHITNFPFLSSNIPSSPVYGVFIFQLIRYARACSSYEFLFFGPGDFPVSYSNRDTSWNAWNRSDFSPISWTNNDTELLNFTSCFHGHLQRMWHASRERLPFRTPGSVPFLYHPRSEVAHRDHFVRRLSVHVSVCLVVTLFW